MGYRPLMIVLCVHIFILFHITEAVFTNEYIQDKWVINGNKPIQVTFQNKQKRLVLTANMQRNGEGNQLTDHIYMTQDQGQAVDNKMQHIVGFFKDHSVEILQIANEGDTIRGRFFNMDRGVSTVITQTDQLWNTLLDGERAGDSGGKIVLTFQVLDAEWPSQENGKTDKPIYISHFGPFSGTWENIINFYTKKASEIQKNEQQMTDLKEVVKQANAAVDEAKALKKMDDTTAQQRRDNILKEASDRAESAENYLKRFEDYMTYNKDTEGLPYTWWRVVQEMYTLPSKIKDASELSNHKIEEVKRVISCKVRAAVGWGPKKAQDRRRKRETEDDTEERDNNTVSLGAQLELLDSDPDSEFFVTKVEFKEVHSGVEETHTWDVERNVLMIDPNTEGSALTAEVQEDGKRKPAEIETAVKKTVISIVLSPRGE